MQNLPHFCPRSHDGFLDMQYDTRYTPFLERAGLDVISFQVRRGLPTFDSAALTALVDRYISSKTIQYSYGFIHALIIDMYSFLPILFFVL